MMKTICIYTIFFFLLLSCKSLFLQEDISGKYMFKGKDVRHTLKLSADSTFFLEKIATDVRIQGYGKWYHLTEDTLFLKCNDPEDPYEVVSNNYMPQREWKVYFQRRNKIQLQGYEVWIPLKRVRRQDR